MLAGCNNQTWNFVPTPANAFVIDSKLIYSIKVKSNGSLGRYKVLFVAQGYKHKYGTDYDETFALVAKMTAVRALLGVTAV